MYQSVLDNQTKVVITDYVDFETINVEVISGDEILTLELGYNGFENPNFQIMWAYSFIEDDEISFEGMKITQEISDILVDMLIEEYSK